jgi:N-acetyl-1-D-myo-inositol-2-amino-2-deoxy-alpha-D-glucopyranoside deacetylase
LRRRGPIGDALPTLLSVHPHPDDETIACGGVLARYVDEGARVVVVTCTGGEVGENQSGIDLGGRAMAEVRRDELAAALAALGVTEHEWLGYRDSGMAGEETNTHPDSFAAAPTDAAARRLAAIVRRVRPGVVVSDDEQGTYGHPDHVKAHEVTVRAVRLAADRDADVDGDVWRVAKRYVVALPRTRLLTLHERMLAEGLASPFGEEPVDAEGLPFGVPDEQVTTTVDIGPWLERKRAALRAHASQIGPDSFFLNLPDDLTSEVFGREHFALEDGILDVHGHEDDLFAGLR